jgi:hypothetical protein
VTDSSLLCFLVAAAVRAPRAVRQAACCNQCAMKHCIGASVGTSILLSVTGRLLMHTVSMFGMCVELFVTLQPFLYWMQLEASFNCAAVSSMPVAVGGKQQLYGCCAIIASGCCSHERCPAIGSPMYDAQQV